jgi:hypothetical protein
MEIEIRLEKEPFLPMIVVRRMDFHWQLRMVVPRRR